MDVQSFDVVKRRVLSRLINRGGRLLPGPIGLDAARAYRDRAHKIAAWIYDRGSIVKKADGSSCECPNCSWAYKAKYARHTYGAEVYDSPFDDKAKVLHFCSDECRDAYLYEGDFSYQFCEACGRDICVRNPRNGWHTHFREINEYGDEICLSCYEADILENGCAREKFAKGQLPGMFFSWGNDELLEAGFLPVPGYQNHFVRGSGSEACAVAVDLIDKGGKVICAYEAMGIGGGEGFISLYVKGLDLGAVSNG